MQTTRPHPFTPARRLGVAVALAVATTAGTFWLSHARAQQATSAAEPAIPRGVLLASWQDNGRGGAYLLRVVAGNPPLRAIRMVGTVTSDVSCAPDALGLSHCHNGIDLASGVHLTVVNTHRMSEHPCLSPGRSVAVTGFDSNWVTVRTSAA